MKGPDCEAKSGRFELVLLVFITWAATTLTASAILHRIGGAYAVPSILATLTMLVLSPVLEEALFRGVLFKQLKRFFGRPFAYVVSAGVFALFHSSPEQVYAGFVCGLVFALVYERTGSVRASMLAHVGYNILTLSFTGTEVPVVLFHPLCIILYNAGIAVWFLHAVQGGGGKHV